MGVLPEAPKRLRSSIALPRFMIGSLRAPVLDLAAKGACVAAGGFRACLSSLRVKPAVVFRIDNWALGRFDLFE